MSAETDIQFEVWQDGDMVATADSLSDAEHFMVVFGQDGPVEAKTSILTRFPGFNKVSVAASPAPEGEASLWGCADGNGIDPRLVFRDRPTAEQVAADTNMVVQPLYASPVVPVGVSREEQRPLAEAIYQQVGPLLAECSEPNPEDYIDAIIAALRPTDTGGSDDHP